MKRLFREPLVHFLLLGAALFLVYTVLHWRGDESPEEIVVTSGKIESLFAGFKSSTRREPTAAELKNMIDDYVKEEIFNREAVKLGLDQDDTVIRRRLRQKMVFQVEDQYPTDEPTEADLAEYLAHHAERFAQEQRFSFRQVYLNPEKRGDQLQPDATALLARLKENPTTNITQLGDGVMLPNEFVHEGDRFLTTMFGADFVAGLAKLTTGEWSGPVRSSRGIHLVLVSVHTERRQPALSEIHNQVRNDFLNARREKIDKEHYETLLARYRVTVEQIPPNATPSPAPPDPATKAGVAP